MEPNFPSKFDPYKILGISQGASKEEIKQARNRLALQNHADKGGSNEFMQRINEAYATLVTPEKLQDYLSSKDDDDDEGSVSDFNAHLPSGRKTSDQFKEKIRRWQEEGPSLPTQIFHNINLTDKADPNHPTLNGSKDSFERLIQGKTLTVNEILASQFPNVWEWSQEEIAILPKEIWNLKGWETDVAFIEEDLSISDQMDDKNEGNEIETILKEALAKTESFSYSINKEVKELRDPISYPKIKDIQQSIEESFICSKPLISSSTRHEPGKRVSLLPLNSTLKTKLGFIPEHVVSNSAVQLNKVDKSCENCKKEFSLFVWRYNCMMCGNSICAGCQSFRQIPDYKSSVRVCRCCTRQLYKSYSQDWVTPLQEESVQKLVTLEYLALVDAPGYADSSTFLKLVDVFILLDKPEHAIQCHCSGNGDWLELALKFAKHPSQRKHIKTCLNQISKLFYQEDWIKNFEQNNESEILSAKILEAKNQLDSEGKKAFLDLVTHCLSINKPELAIQCHFIGNGSWSELGLQFASYPIYAKYKQICLQHADKKTFLEFVDDLLLNNKPELALQCYMIEKGDWLELVQKLARFPDYRKYIKICFNKIKRTAQEWSNLGDQFASDNHLALALIAYQRAEFKANDYVQKALKYSNSLMGRVWVDINM